MISVPLGAPLFLYIDAHSPSFSAAFQWFVGMGKSTFLANSLIQDIRAGNGCALFDPHGDLAQQVLEYVPPWRRNDVIHFNPADIEYPIGFNPLANVDPDRRPPVVSTVVDALHSIWPDSWGPQLQMFLEATCGALLEMPGVTLPCITWPSCRRSANSGRVPTNTNYGPRGNFGSPP